tara:strand:- start:26 stop:526 length:501 start_codon:yes stop_codon:yes gene_type:complete
MLSVLLTVNLKLEQHGWRHINMPCKEQYDKNKEKYREEAAKWREDNLEQDKENKIQWQKDNFEKQKVYAAKNRAKQKNIYFELTEQDIKDVWPEDNKCPALGIPLKRNEGVLCDNSSSLDRVDNNKGYTRDNIQIVSMLANQIMSSATPDQVLQVGRYFKKLIDSK